MQESVFAIVIVFFFLLPLDAVSAQKGFAVNRAFDGIFLALFIEKYVAAQQSGHETGFFLGMFFGIHGYDHYWLAKLPKEQMEKDIDMALEAMDEIIDKECFVMNYPYGNYSEEVISYVKQKGCGLGVSVEARGAQLGVDNRFALPRWDCNDVYPKGEKV